MKRSSGPRKTTDLSKSVHQQLSMYALAAGAAGVSALALAPPADAKIIYTKTNTPILANTTYNLDVNNDGMTDFVIRFVTYFTSANRQNRPHQPISTTYAAHGVASVSVQGSQNNAVVKTRHFAADLPTNDPVWKKRNFGQGWQKMASCTFFERKSTNHTSYTQNSSGPWIDQSRYLGLKFSISGQTHYGWARLKVWQNRCGFSVTLTGYAYETIPNKLILTGHTKGPDHSSTEVPDASLTMPTPEPATLGALAMGTPGLSIWRRKESALQGN
jgi:hypothetical protein